MTTPDPTDEREWAKQAKADAATQHPNDPVAAQWAYRKMVLDRAKERAAQPGR